MNHYVITIKVQTGEYEKTVTTLTKALTEYLAVENALLGQCHCEIDSGAEWLEKGQELEDLYGEFIYTVYDCIEVLPEEVTTLKKYL